MSCNAVNIEESPQALSPSSSTVQPQPKTQKMQEINIFLAHFVQVSKEEARTVFMDYLSGKEVKKIDAGEIPTYSFVVRLSKMLLTLIPMRILAFPLSVDGCLEWFQRCVATIQAVRAEIPSGKILGTKDKVFNLLYGIGRLELDEPEAMFHVPVGIDKRLERWKDYTLCGVLPRAPARPRDRLFPSPPELLIEQMEVANLTIQISCAHAQGDRANQEDGHVIGKIINCQEEIGVLAIIDGHGGSGLTKFLQINCLEALRFHLQKAGKPLKSLEDAEIENLLVTFPVRLQHIWKEKKEEWRRIYLLDQLERFIAEMFSDLINNWKRALRESGESISLPSESEQEIETKEDALQTREIISQALDWIRSEYLKNRIDQVNENTESVFFGRLQEINSELQTKIQSVEGRSAFFQKHLTKRELNRLNTILIKVRNDLKEQQDQWRYDPGAVVAIALILERAHSAELWSINVGDSAILLLQDREVVQVTEEASLKTYRFRKGVECRGGMVGEVKPFGLRVLSESAIPNFARSIGDLDVPGLTPRGKVQRIRIHPSATAIVGCDGVFENLSYLQVGKKCQDLLSNPQVHVAGELALYAYKMGSPDNISCIVAQIRSKQ